MNLLGKMCLMIILKVTKKQASTPYLENTGGQINGSRLRIRTCLLKYLVENLMDCILLCYPQTAWFTLIPFLAKPDLSFEFFIKKKIANVASI